VNWVEQSLSKWPMSVVQQIAAPHRTAIAIGPFGSRMKADCYVDEGVPVIRGSNISLGRRFSGDFVYREPCIIKPKPKLWCENEPIQVAGSDKQ
jgi:hypothetical protein